MSPPVYASDPEQEPDSQFVPGELSCLVIGNRGRLLDARRTPITLTAVMPATGSFEVELGAFEDAGARWELGLEEVERFQFARSAARLEADAVAELARARERFDREMTVGCDEAARARTNELLDTARAEARAVLERESPIASLDVDACIARREGNAALFAVLHRFLDARALGGVERRFTQTFVRNPRSGEIVKGHAIVLAELGLRAYRGPVVRNPDLFVGEWSKERRAEHLVARLAFVGELWSMLGVDSVTLYRGAAADEPLMSRRPGSFVSATFSRAVAEAHFDGGPSTRAALLWRGRMPTDRLLMTFLETEAMNDRFREAEAALIDGPDVM